VIVVAMLVMLPVYEASSYYQCMRPQATSV
jgi:hypothetical protein